MPRFKRSVGAGPWLPPHKPVAKARPSSSSSPSVLHEGFAIRIPSRSEAGPIIDRATAAPEGREAAGVPSIGDNNVLDGEPRPYGRGSSVAALQAMNDPEKCISHLKEGMQANTTKGPTASRRTLWAALAAKAGYYEPFNLEPNMIYAAVVSRGILLQCVHLWLLPGTALKICSQRDSGPPKQASGLPMDKLSKLNIDQQLAPGGPSRPVRSTLLAAWWLLREIEASRARKKHITVVRELKRITWRLPSSKTDQAALGAERTHTCNCAFSPPEMCPYHLMVQHLGERPHDDDLIFQDQLGERTTKSGWADTFQELARHLGLPTTHGNGARAYTGHSARVSGARHLAASQVELWRIQLFGRWGSEVFLHYIQDTPLTQLNDLAQESSARLSIQAAKEELLTLIRSAQHLKPQLALPNVDMLEDCESAADIAPAPADSGTEFILNANGGGKLHRVLDRDPTEHPRSWRTRCGWRLGRETTEHRWIHSTKAENYSARATCSKCFPQTRQHPSSESSSSSSADSSHS